MKQNIILFLKGFLIGSFILIPGISGGLICIFLGVYENIISSLSNLIKDFKKGLKFLIPITLGGIFGLILCSKALKVFYTNYETQFFFLVITVLSISVVFIKRKFKKITINDLIAVFLGLIFLFSIYMLPPFSSNNKSLINYIYFLLLGILIAIGLILPGISVSHMLLIVGLYDLTITALNNYDIIFLAKIGFVTLFGVIISIKLLNHCIEKYERFFYHVVIGFIIGSIIQFII